MANRLNIGLWGNTTHPDLPVALHTATNCARAAVHCNTHPASSGSPARESARWDPDTRNIHMCYWCREPEVRTTVAASPNADFGFKSGTRIINLLVSYDSEVRIGACCKLGRTSESGHWVAQYFSALYRDYGLKRTKKPKR